ncbi:hypothetical protein [Nostoc sp. MG11]|uniref:hypothetical protein n=1 Tax=Nostoc sp. MG11 TaxID=2721166 RepID=UPI00186754F7|nr:hypothetical protein [Nostoc sp. MG11]
MKDASTQKSLLSYGSYTSTKVGLVAIAGCSIATISLLIQILNYGAIKRFSNQAPTLVQLASGETAFGKSVNSNERSNEVIKKFIAETFIKMFNWDGLVQTSNEQGEVATKADTGVEVQGLSSTTKVTTKAFEAAFALSEKANFRAAFLRKLAQMTPSEIFNANAQVSFVPRFISEPRQIGEGKWQVDVVATLITFTRADNAGKGIPFNKRITVEAITPLLPSSQPTDLASKVYTSRSSGLEITQIVDLDLSRKNGK